MPRTKLPQLSRSGTTKARLAKPSSSSLAEVPKPHSDIATYVRRRRDKAERDERMDLTTVLTPVKTYVSLSFFTFVFWRTRRHLHCHLPLREHSARTLGLAAERSVIDRFVFSRRLALRGCVCRFAGVIPRGHLHFKHLLLEDYPLCALERSQEDRAWTRPSA